MSFIRWGIRYVAYFLLSGIVAQAGSEWNAVHAAASVSFRLVAGNETKLPGGTSNFSNFGMPVIQGGTIAFQADVLKSSEGIYVERDGKLELAAGFSTMMPGSHLNFGTLGSLLSIDQGRVAFYGGNGYYSGVFAADGTGITTIVDSNTLIPGTEETFDSFGNLRLDGNNFGFDAFTGAFDRQGTYKSVGGVLTEVASNETPGPEGIANLDSFVIGAAAIHNGKVAFHARETEPFPATPRPWSLYTDMFGSLDLVAGGSVLVPGTTGYFHDINLSTFVTDDAVLFTGHGWDQNGGIYRYDGSAVTPFTVNSVPQLDTPDSQSYLVDVDGDHVVIEKNRRYSSRSAFFTNVTGPLERIVGWGDTLDGKVVESIQTYQESLSGNQFVFRAFFRDFSSGIYVATIVPEPGSTATCALGLVGGLAAVGRRRTKRFAI